MPSITITAKQAKQLARGKDINIEPEPLAPVGPFKDGDIVAGPFVVNPDLLDIVTLNEGGHGYGLGLGVVDSAQPLFGPGSYVPVRIVVGDRKSGGYYASQLTQIKGATLR